MLKTVVGLALMSLGDGRQGSAFSMCNFLDRAYERGAGLFDSGEKLNPNLELYNEYINAD